MCIRDRVRFDFGTIGAENYPFSIYDHFVFLGEVKQMPGHCVVAHTKTGQVHVGYHTDNFVELTEEEC